MLQPRGSAAVPTVPLPNIGIFTGGVQYHGSDGCPAGNAYMKRVWVKTMTQAWALLPDYDGDMVFLEDDLRVAPDFFSAVAAASRISCAACTAARLSSQYAESNDAACT